jgi:hypothetical protein
MCPPPDEEYHERLFEIVNMSISNLGRAMDAAEKGFYFDDEEQKRATEAADRLAPKVQRYISFGKAARAAIEGSNEQ